MTKRRPLQLLILAAVAIAMVLSMTACGEKEPAIDPEYVAQLEQENADLRMQVEDLSGQLGEMERNAVLKDYTLKAAPREDSTGAVVTLTATPMSRREGQTARIIVRLDGEEAASQEAQWNGDAYTASFDLDAADGYGYYCVLTEEDGTQKQAVLANADNPVYDTCIYLATSLNPYCNMFMQNWAQEDGQLILSSGYIQVQMPRITSDRTPDYSSAELVLQLNGEEIERQPVDIPRGEGEGSYEMAVSDIRFTMPAMEDDYQLDLWLEVTLTDGSQLTLNGCSWSYSDGDLIIAVG